MFADDEKDEMEEQEQDNGQPDQESFDAEATILDSMPSVEAASAEEEEPPAPETPADKAAEQDDDAWQTVVSTPAQKVEEPTVEGKSRPATPQPKADFAPTTPLETVGAGEEGAESKVPLGDFLSNLGIKDQTFQIVVLVVVGLGLLCCLCSCVGLAASAALGNY